MRKRLIFTDDFKNIVFVAEQLLFSNVNKINDLNVFPVPDGDTGSNMHRTFAAGKAALLQTSAQTIGELVQEFSNAMLLEARGNSGVILSQLFRGFANYVIDKTSINGKQLAEALQSGIHTAYEAVVNPIEGTILTVAREAANQALAVAEKDDDVTKVMIAARDQAQLTLARTPQMLEVLREVGVVDSGGQGLVLIYEGFVRSLSGKPMEGTEESMIPSSSITVTSMSNAKAQSQIETEQIEHFYDIEFFVKLNHKHKQTSVIKALRKSLKKLGDSILIVPHNDLLKIHVHSNTPGEVLTIALKWGELFHIHIENMRDQHRQYITNGQADAQEETSKQSMIAVASGSGIADVFRSIGVETVVNGGETLNPSVEDLLQAINQVKGNACILLPNNANIKMAAEQAKAMANKTVEVIPTRTIPQGVAAALAFQEESNFDDNIANMKASATAVKSGQVTYATRHTSYRQLNIKKGNFLGIVENEIVSSAPELLDVCQTVLKQLIQDDEILTVFIGNDVDPEQHQTFEKWLYQQYPDLEIEIINGKQPINYYLFSVE